MPSLWSATSIAPSNSRSGNGLDENTEMGPAINEAQLKTDLSYVEIGKSEGAKMKCGGNRLDQGEYQHGYFMEPTVFVDVDPKMRIAQEEIFGPVVSIIPVKTWRMRLPLPTASSTAYRPRSTPRT
jgi:acyl-CoA reductase-like NAD-dependent aldehyde dehydrogenase